MAREGQVFLLGASSWRIDEIRADPRYSFMFSGMLVSDSMPSLSSAESVSP